MSKKISLPIVGTESLVEPTPAPPKSGSVMDEIDSEVKGNTVLLYMKGNPEQPMCGFSARAAHILSQLGRPFKAVDILLDPEKRQAIKEYSDWPTIPQVYVGGEFLGGSDLLMQMYQSGELKKLIEAAFAD